MLPTLLSGITVRQRPRPGAQIAEAAALAFPDSSLFGPAYLLRPLRSHHAASNATSHSLGFEPFEVDELFEKIDKAFTWNHPRRKTLDALWNAYEPDAALSDWLARALKCLVSALAGAD